VPVKIISDADRARRIGQLLVKGMYLFKEAESRRATATVGSVQSGLTVLDVDVMCDGLNRNISTNSNMLSVSGSQEADKEY